LIVLSVPDQLQHALHGYAECRTYCMTMLTAFLSQKCVRVPCSSFGYITRDDGAGGNAECLAPPGWELKEGAAIITECEPGFYKVRFVKIGILQKHSTHI
jgi:hypothetical protein